MGRRQGIWRALVGLALLLAAAVSGCASGVSPASGEKPMIEVILDKEADSALVEFRPGAAIITVDSARGIGGMQARLTEGAWPEKVLVRLRLHGLESLELGYGPYTIATGVSSTSEPAPPPAVYNREVENSVNEPATLTPSQQLPVSLHSDTQEPPGIPLQEGHFEVSLPAHFFESGEDAFTLQWIDFYR